MKKRNKIFSSLLATGLGVTAIAASLPMLTSCSAGGNKITQVTYNVKTTTKTFTNGIGANVAHDTIQYPAETNPNAQAEVQNFNKNLSVGTLQYDFKRVLTDFYEIYEVETGNIEMEIENITVKSKNSDGSFQLIVEYELEVDTYANQPRDKESIQRKEIKWTPKLTTMDYNEICQITNTLRTFGDKDNKNNIDLEDLKEIFLGDTDDMDDWDFDNDDIGIFDRVGAIGKTKDNQSSIVAYELKLADIFDQLTNSGKTYAIRTRASGDAINKNTVFKIPSLALNNDGSVVLVPNETPSFKFTSILDGTTFDQIFNGSNSTLTFTTNKELLDKVFGNSNQVWKDSVSEVEVNNANGTLIIKYKDNTKPWEEVVIARQWGLTPAA